ncbi:MAG: hypothetical protein ACLPTM_12315 [Steroidobacteraceae bacterium]
MRTSRAWIVAALCVAASVVMGSAAAQTARSGGGANVELLQQLQQLASDRTQLQAQNDKLNSELAELKKERDALKAGQGALEQRARGSSAALAESNAQREATERELTQYKTKTEELIAKFREIVQKLRETETDDAAAKQSLATREHELASCADHNVALYHLNAEVLTRLDRQGFWSYVAQAEPFTKIKRVQNENLVDDYRSRAQDQRLAAPKPAVLKAGPAAATSAPAAPAPQAEAPKH